MLYKQIQYNRRQTVVFVSLFCLLVMGLGCAVGYMSNGDVRPGLIMAGIILLIYIPITYLTASSQVLRMAGAKEIQKADHPRLFNIVEDLCLAARLPMPKIYIVDDPSPNAFATGIKPEKSAVAFTTGLLEQLNREELEGVAAHELAHIRNYDIRLTTICIALVAVVAIVADIGSRMLFFRGSNRGGRGQKTHPILLVAALVFVILAPLAARFVHLAISRNREYLADATAVELTRNSVGLKNALLKISGSNIPVNQAKAATASMYIANPFRHDKKRRANWFSTHPPIASRIERLERM